MNRVNLHNIFPTTVGIVDFDREFTKKELEVCTKMERRSNEGNQTSTNYRVLELKELKKLKEFILTSVNDYFDKIYCPTVKSELCVTQSWLNYTSKGQFHHKHAHPNSFISGVFYINADIKQDRIYFYREIYRQLRPSDPREWNIYNSDSWWFETGTGKLMLFPSSLTHMVPRVEHDDTRISLSFNTIFKGQFGDTNSLTELILGE